MYTFTQRLEGSHIKLQDAACRHPFLKQAGNCTIPPEALCQWLVQKRYYQFAYLNFIAQLCANLKLDSYAFSNEDEESLEWKTFCTLQAMLNAIKNEVDFFNKTIEDYGLELLEEKPNKHAENYRTLFKTCSDSKAPLAVGLTVLWTTEYAYLKGWNYAKREPEQEGCYPVETDIDAIAALHCAFLPRWTSKEFERVIKSLADLLEEWIEREPRWKRHCTSYWQQVLELEAKFWPDV